MKFEDTTVHITITKDQLLYCFMADTTEEFYRRMEQLANDIQVKIEKELFKELMKKEWITNDVVYCDTDSMYMLHPEKHLNVINEWNVFAAERVAERLPAEYVALRKLGHFDNIALDDSGGVTDTFARFKTLGAKRYIKLYSKSEKHKHIRSIVHITITKDQLLYCFMADTTEEFYRRMEQLANDIQVKIEKELFKELMKKEV